MMIYTYEANGTVFQVQLDRQPDGSYVAVIGDETYAFSAERLSDGGWLLQDESTRAVAYTAAQADRRYVHVQGAAHELTVSDSRSRRRHQTGDSGRLNAQMPGQVMQVLVREGETVTAGQTLLLLEAMKMEIRVTAPFDGTVTRLQVNAGDVVERGQLLADLTPAEAD